MFVYALCHYYDSFGGDDTSVLGLFSTEKKLSKRVKRKRLRRKRFGKRMRTTIGVGLRCLPLLASQSQSIMVITS